MNTSTNIPKQYLRNRKGQMRGVIVATPHGVGWSICATHDKFDKNIGLKIAINRANFHDPERKLAVPAQIADLVSHMDIRRQRYYKN